MCGRRHDRRSNRLCRRPSRRGFRNLPHQQSLHLPRHLNLFLRLDTGSRLAKSCCTPTAVWSSSTNLAVSFLSFRTLLMREVYVLRPLYSPTSSLTCDVSFRNRMQIQRFSQPYSTVCLLKGKDPTVCSLMFRLARHPRVAATTSPPSSTRQGMRTAVKSPHVRLLWIRTAHNGSPGVRLYKGERTKLLETTCIWRA